MTFNFIKNRKVFFAITIALLVVSVVCFFIKGFNLDIEFVGGTEYTFQLENDAVLDRDALSKELSAELGDKFSSIRTAGDDSFIVRTTLEGTDYDALNGVIFEEVKNHYEVEESAEFANGKLTVTVLGEKAVEEAPAAEEAEVAETSEVSEVAESTETVETAEETNETEKTVEEKLAEVLAAAELGIDNVVVTPDEETENKYVISYKAVSVVSETVKESFKAVTVVEDGTETVDYNVSLKNETTISAEVSDSLKNTAIVATLVAVVLMLIYIALRFEGRASLAAIICLAHDIIIMLFAYSIFEIPVSSTIIAAILTILGYSINATIVIFDRIRENRKNITSQYTFEDAANDGIKSTIWRSLNTTITTLITIGLVYILGVTSIKNFALPLIVGILAGVYSSVCLSGNVWVALKKIGSKKTK